MAEFDTVIKGGMFFDGRRRQNAAKAKRAAQIAGS